MTLTVLHMRRMDTLTMMALTARLSRDEGISEDLLEAGLREKVRNPTLSWSVEKLETLHNDAVARNAYFAQLDRAQKNWASVLYLLNGYQPVAQIATTDLDVAFKLTNSINGPWQDSGDARLTVLPITDNRGTAVQAFSSDQGTLVRNNETAEYFLIGRNGFVSLGDLDQRKAA